MATPGVDNDPLYRHLAAFHAQELHEKLRQLGIRSPHELGMMEEAEAEALILAHQLGKYDAQRMRAAIAAATNESHGVSSEPHAPLGSKSQQRRGLGLDAVNVSVGKPSSSARGFHLDDPTEANDVTIEIDKLLLATSINAADEEAEAEEEEGEAEAEEEGEGEEQEEEEEEKEEEE